MKNELNNITLKVIDVHDAKGNWIGNIAINLDNLEIENNLLNGYYIGNKKDNE